MPKIAHFGDIHLKEGPRFAETLRCLDFAIDDAIAQEVDLFAIPGDVFDGKSTPAERNAFAQRVRKMTHHAPLVIARGNHDKPGDLQIFGALEAEHGIDVHELPDRWYVGGVRIFSLPHFDKSNAAGALPPDMAIEQADALMTQALRHTLEEFKSFIERNPDDKTPTILIGHFTVAGSQLSNGETMAAHGIQLSIGDLDIGFDAVMANHIHKAQACDAMGRIWYAGSISRANFGEDKDPKGYLLWTIPERGAEPMVEFRDVPAREMLTYTATYDPEFGWDEDYLDWDANGEEVRVRLTVPEDRRANAEEFALNASIQLCRAHDIQIEIRTIPVTRVRSQEIATAQTPAEKLQAWATSTSTQLPEGVFEKLLQLEKEVS